MRLILLLITSLLFINSNAQVVSIFDIDLSRYPVIRAKVNALDEDGNQIRDLAPSNLELAENGIGRTINLNSCPNAV